MEPMSDSIVDESVMVEKGHIVFTGAGSGITPLFYIAKYIYEQIQLIE